MPSPQRENREGNIIPELAKLKHEHAMLRLRNQSHIAFKQLHNALKEIDQKLNKNLRRLNSRKRSSLMFAEGKRKMTKNLLAFNQTKQTIENTHKTKSNQARAQANRNKQNVYEHIAMLQKAIAVNELKTARTEARAKLNKLVNTQRQEESQALRNIARRRESTKNRLNAILAKSNKNIYKNTSNNNLRFFINKRASVYGNAHKNKANKFERILKSRRELPAFKQTQQGKNTIALIAKLKTEKLTKRMPRFISGFLNTLKEQHRRKYAENLVKKIVSNPSNLAEAREAERHAKITQGGVMGFQVNLRTPPPAWNYLKQMPINKTQYSRFIESMDSTLLPKMIEQGASFWKSIKNNKQYRGNIPNSVPELLPRPADMSLREYARIKTQYESNSRQWLKTLWTVWLRWRDAHPN